MLRPRWGVVVRLRMAWRRRDFKRARRIGAISLPGVTPVRRRPPLPGPGLTSDLKPLPTGDGSGAREVRPEASDELAERRILHGPTPEWTSTSDSPRPSQPSLPSGDNSPPRPRRPWDPPTNSLAVHVDALRREVESLATKLDTLVRAQRERAAVDDIAELRNQVEQILDTLTDDDASPAEWFWLRMNEQVRDEKFAELADWVETVLRQQYPDYLADQIRPCWPNHPEARWELSWLYQQWSLTYLAKHPTSRDASEWHDRWAPGVIRRLSQVMSRCEGTCQRLLKPERAGGARRRVPL